MAGVSLTNKKEQLSTMPLEDKHNKGGTWVCISNEHQLVNQEINQNQEKLMKETMQLSAFSSHGSDGTCKGKV